MLRSGYTTGACAAAAAKGAALLLKSQSCVSDVSIELPSGASAMFYLQGQSFSADEACCFVVKDAGDDPDVTNGVEVHARVKQSPPQPPFANGGSHIIIEGGAGIGRITKPGLAVSPGEWAINPVPRSMIEQAVRSVFSSLIPHPSSLRIVISIPDGVERARKTLNARLGIVGGLSILGTTGIVRPISAKAWTDTIDAALDVARACNCETVVLSTGRSSEIAAQRHLSHIPEESFIMMGDHVAYALQACAKRGYREPIVACQFAKLLKIACGHENTHAAASELDLALLHSWAEASHLHSDILDIIDKANTAREIAVTTSFDKNLTGLVIERARLAGARHVPEVQIYPLLCGYDGFVVKESCPVCCIEHT